MSFTISIPNDIKGKCIAIAHMEYEMKRIEHDSDGDPEYHPEYTLWICCRDLIKKTRLEIPADMLTCKEDRTDQ